MLISIITKKTGRLIGLPQFADLCVDLSSPSYVISLPAVRADEDYPMLELVLLE